MKKKIAMGIVVILICGMFGMVGYSIYKWRSGNVNKVEVTKEDVTKEDVTKEDVTEKEVNKKEVSKKEGNIKDDTYNGSYMGLWLNRTDTSINSGSVDTSVNQEFKMVLGQVTAKSLQCSIKMIGQSDSPLEAIKQENGEYVFTYGQSQGSIMLKWNFIRVNIDGLYSGDLKFRTPYMVFEKCEISEYFIDYESAIKKEKESPNHSAFIRNDYTTGVVVNVSVSRLRLRSDELDQYLLFGVDFAYNLEDCNKAFGKPYETKETEELKSVSYVKDKYLLGFDFNHDGVMVYMNCSYADELKELGLEKKGDFAVRGTQLVKYIGGFEEEKTVVIPEGITEIERGAFSYDMDRMPAESKARMKTISLVIPNSVALHTEAFTFNGPIHITFEEGREYIDQGAFLNANSNGVETTVKLPSTIKELKKDAFAGGVEVELNEGLEVIGDGALPYVDCELPSTVKILGESTVRFYKGSNLALPDGLEEIGNRCIWIEAPTSRIRIPASVRKIGENPISYAKNKDGGGVEVDKNNMYYKSSKEGWLYTKDGKTLLYASCNKGNLIVPEGVEYVGEGSLNLNPKGKIGDQKIILPKSLKKYNMKAIPEALVVFQGEVPEFDWEGIVYMEETVFDVPDGKIEEYRKALEQFSTQITIK